MQSEDKRVLLLSIVMICCLGNVFCFAFYRPPTSDWVVVVQVVTLVILTTMAAGFSDMYSREPK